MGAEWVVFWYLTMVLTMLLAGFLVMSISLYFSVKNDIKIKKIDFQTRIYEDERADRERFTKMTITPLNNKDNN